MKILFIINEGAGSFTGADGIRAADLRAALSAAGLGVEARVAPPRRLRETLRAAVAERPDILIVAGGDGTLSTAAGCLANTPVALGVLPLGTLNHFARDLGLPTDWRAAVETVAHGERRQVDLGEVNGHLFLNNCSLGSYPEAVRRREALRRTHGAGKWVAMMLATLTVWRRLRRLRLRIDSGDNTTELRTPFVFIGNNRYSGHVLAQCGRECLDDGQLWIYTTRVHRRAALLRLLWQSLTRCLDDVELLETQPVTEALITSAGRTVLPIAADGEVLDVHLPLQLKIRPGALTVIAPAKTNSSSRSAPGPRSDAETQIRAARAPGRQRPVVRSR